MSSLVAERRSNGWAGAPTTAGLDDAAVRLLGASKRFGKVVALEDATLSIRRGELMTLLGPSGCGKTTTLRLIAGLLQPDEGEIFIAGRPVAGVPPNKRDVGIVFQNYALFPHMTVGANVAFGLEMRGVSRGDVRQRVSAALALVQLVGVESRYPHQLSGGQQQRVALARALVFRPAVLLLDEPLAALDKRLRMDMELKMLQRQVGITTIFVTHDQEEALTLSDRIAVMNAGRIEQLGTPEDIYERPATPFVLEFIGRANMFVGELGAEDGRPVLRAGALTLAVPEASAGASHGRAILAIRPERVRLCVAPPANGATAGVNVVSAAVTNVVYLGSHAHYYVRLATGEELVAYHSAAEGPAIKVESHVWATWRTEDVRVVPA
jgi:spermidine/putrescine transport system ATP-binding protein